MFVAKRITVASFALVAALSGMTQAATLVQWNFNSPTPDATTSTGTLTASVNNSAGTPTIGSIGTIVEPWFFANPRNSPYTSVVVGGSTSSDPALDNSTIVTATSGPTGDDSSYFSGSNGNAPAQGTGNATFGVEFKFNASNYESLSVTFDQRVSSAASRFWQVFYSPTGLAGDYAAVGDAYAFNYTTTASNEAYWLNGITRTLPTSADNNPNGAVKIVAIFDPANNATYTRAGSSETQTQYSANGQARVDYITVTGTAVPEPASLSLIGIGMLLLARRRTRRS